MKKWIWIAVSVLLLSGCTASDTGSTAETSDIDEKSVLINGITVSLDDPFSSVSALLGNPQSSESVASCVYNGDETIYTYDGITVQTYPGDSAEQVSSYKITSDQYKVSGNYQVGSSSEGLAEVYPEGTDTGVSFLVTEDSYGRSYAYANGRITEIELYDIVQ